MLHARTTETASKSHQGNLGRAAEQLRQMRPPSAVSAPPQTALNSSPQAPQRDRYMGLQRVFGNQALLRMADRAAPTSGSQRTVQGAPSVVHDVLQSPGHQLDSNVRRNMESSLGRSFDDVVVHIGDKAAESARAVDAHAYTVGRDIVFASGQYAPETTRGQGLIAHELAHVVENTRRSHAHQQLAREAASPATAQPQTVPDDAKAQAHLRSVVDTAVRTMFGIKGAGIAAANVSFVGETEFAAQFPASELEDKLFTVFLDFGTDTSGYAPVILDYNNIPYRYTGASSPSAVSQLRTFVQSGIAKGYFEGQTREYDVTTGSRFPPFRVTPGQLIAAYIGGFTTTSGARSGRKILVQAGVDVGTLVHEACHFYVHNNFTQMIAARKDGEEYLRGARIGQILTEGFTEHFASEVMVANGDKLGPAGDQAYGPEVDVAGDIMITVGEKEARKAFFQGDQDQIRRIGKAVDQYKQTPEDLLLPGFIVD
jgi:hypothetical protein